MASTNAPSWVSWEASSAALNAAIEPVTPSRIRLSRTMLISKDYTARPL